MNIGFDLDKVFINYPPLIPHSIIDRLYKKKKDGQLMYRIPSKVEQWFRLATHLSILRPPILENIMILQNLTENKKHKYFLISSRFGFLRKKTEELVEKYNLDKFFDEMYFNYLNKQPHFFKDEVLQKLKIDRYVDDDLPLLSFLSSRHPKTIFFWLNSRLRKKISENLYAISGLDQMRLQYGDV